MSFTPYIKELGRGLAGARALPKEEAHRLYGAMLDGDVPDLELGAITIALRIKGETLDEMLGFMAAAGERVNRLRAPVEGVRPIVLPSYNGARKEANLTPLLALLLARFGVPILVHGLTAGYGRVASAQILTELGCPPCTTLNQVQAVLAEQGVAFVPLPLLSPGMASLLALRERMGVRNSTHSLVKLLDPFEASGVTLAAATHPDFIDLMRGILLGEGRRGLLFRGTEGEAFANPKRRPRLEYVHDGECETLFEAERDSLRELPSLPVGTDAVTTAQWTRRVVEGKEPLPLPIASQVACCLFACGYVDDLGAAKAAVSARFNMELA